MEYACVRACVCLCICVSVRVHVWGYACVYVCITAFRERWRLLCTIFTCPTWMLIILQTHNRLRFRFQLRPAFPADLAFRSAGPAPKAQSQSDGRVSFISSPVSAHSPLTSTTFARYAVVCCLCLTDPSAWTLVICTCYLIAIEEGVRTTSSSDSVLTPCQPVLTLACRLLLVCLTDPSA